MWSKLNHWLFIKVYVVAFRIPHNVFVGPVGVEFQYELCGLLKFFAGCYEKKFAITKVNKHGIHGTATSLLEREYCYSLGVSVMQITMLCQG
jgi:hypothetical protein